MDKDVHEIGAKFLSHADGIEYQESFSDLGSDFLEHHGREGQKWGVQNGPPYPLNREGLRKFRRHMKEQRAAKRKTEIMHDPEKLYKHASEFTKEELDSAVAKIQSMNEVKKLIPRAEMPSKLTNQQKKWAKDPNLLIKNFDKFSPKQLELAMQIEEKIGNLQYRKIKKSKLPKDWLDLGVGYLESFANLGHQILNIKNTTKKLVGYKSEEEKDFELVKLANTIGANAKKAGIKFETDDRYTKALSTFGLTTPARKTPAEKSAEKDSRDRQNFIKQIKSLGDAGVQLDISDDKKKEFAELGIDIKNVTRPPKQYKNKNKNRR